MNLQNIFSEIETVDPEVYERMDTRRTAMKQFAKFTGKSLLAAAPLALGSMFKKAYGQTPSDVIATLQFALTLEYLEARFYTIGVAASGVQTTANAAALGALSKIRDDENKHVVYLKTVITALGATPVPQPVFDFTAGNGSGTGPFAGWDTNYDIFLAMAQTFEDTGVRAYKGSAGTLIN
ncbi:MAG: ferritin-like domain-containing protein, partial [Ferruginibacter sp.]